MLSFFKKNAGEQPKLEGSESTVSSEEILAEEVTADSTDTDIETALSIHPTWNLAKEDMYSFQFLNNECPPLKPNQISLSGIMITKDGEQYRATAFVRNSLDKAISLAETTLVLLGENEQILGRKTFQLAELGEIPAKSSRPWNFYFTKNNLFTEDLPAEGWKLAFQLESGIPEKHTLDLADSWKKSLASHDKKKLKELVENLEPPKEGEVNFLGLQAQTSSEGELHITLLIRNGSKKDINIEQIPLHVEDAQGDLVAQGGFKLDDFNIKANTSKPWTFIFPKSLVKKATPDFSRWKAYAPQAD